MRRHTAPLLILALAAATLACGGSTTDAAPAAAPLPVPQAPGMQASGGSAYPDLYRNLSLPEIDGGTVTSTGRQTTSLRDGLAITVTSGKTVDEARAFYQERLAAAGWTAAPQARGASVPGLPVAGVTFTKDRMTYTATITAAPDGGVRIQISVVEN
jgi:hypothetical protein